MRWQQVVQPIGTGADSSMKRRAVTKAFISPYQLIQISLWGKILSDHAAQKKTIRGSEGDGWVIFNEKMVCVRRLF